MAKQGRNGGRKLRSQARRREQELGYYVIVTDTEGTERCYFEGFNDCLPEEIKSHLVIRVVETKTSNLIDKCKEYIAYDPQFRIPYIVFDRDKQPKFDEIISRAEKEDINVAWSNPCFEIWLSAYFGNMPQYSDSRVCCFRFGELYKKKTGVEYKKTDKNMYRRTLKAGNEDNAIRIAENRYKEHIDAANTIPSRMIPCTTVHRLVKEIKSKQYNRY